MSLGIVVKGPEGLVLAAESRVTVSAQLQQGPQLHVNYDNATKLLSFGKPNNWVGVVTYGLAAIELRTAYSFLPEFESELPPKKRLTVEEFAKYLSEFFLKQWQASKMPKLEDYAGPSMTFVVAGFDENEPYGKAFLFEIPRNPEPVKRHSEPAEFGITWGGQREFVDRIIKGYDHSLINIISKVLNLESQQVEKVEQALDQLQMPIPFPALPLQDCVNLAIFFIRTTIIAQELTVGIRGTGGPIDVATITRNEGLKFVQRKKVFGESGMMTNFTEGR